MSLDKEIGIKNIKTKDSINIREEIEKYLIHWKWFVLGIFLSLVLSYIYMRYTTPQYSATTSIMIKDNQKSGISKELEAFKDLGIIGGSSSNNPDNEIEILKSRKIIGNTIDTLNLNISYFIDGIIKRGEIYKKENPIKVRYISKSPLFQNANTSSTVSIISKDKFQIKDDNDNVISTHNFNEAITSELGVYKIVKTKYFDPDKHTDVFVKLTGKPNLISNYRARINIELLNEDSSVLILKLKDPIQQKAIDFLNELIIQYNLEAISDKSEVSKKTRDFIDERLKKIGEELALIQDDVKNYKTKNRISGISKEGELALESASKNNEKIIDLRTELNLAKWVQESIAKQSKDETLPQNLGFTDTNISQSIMAYNELITKKNRLSVNAGDKNPLLIQYQSEIAILKTNVKRSISNLIYSLEAKLSQLDKEALKANAKVSSIPVVERGFIDIAREQEIISGLYSYLLKKKEETAISLAVTVPNAKIIDVAYGSNSPVSPRGKVVYLGALFLGFLVPLLALYLINLLDTKIHNKKDIKSNLSVPFLGDIPKSDTKEKIVVSKEARSSISEAFRLIRTNLDFMLTSSDAKTTKFIFTTSTTSGEGKSFISINLAATLALSDKRILLMGMDLRAPKVTEYLNVEDKKGITNYLTDKNLSLDDIKFKIPALGSLDIISSGVIPPNPAELLISEGVERLFNEVKNYYYYDYVIVDTAPINLVTDTLLISKYADMFLYIVRANYLDKRLLTIPEELYENKRFKNMAIVLNDVDVKRGYGYGYGYGGGYGYGYGHQDKKPWYKKVFS